MALKLVTAPAAEPVTLAEIKEHLRVDSDLEDALISALITAARQWAETYQGRAYITQTWNFLMDEFPQSPFSIPMPPLQSVESIKYYDTAVTEYTLPSSSYQVDADSTFGRVALAYGKTWPQTVTLRPMNAVIVQFKAGYGDAVGDVPERVRQAIKVLVADWYENREATDIKEHVEVAFAVKAILGPERMGI